MATKCRDRHQQEATRALKARGTPTERGVNRPQKLEVICWDQNIIVKIDWQKLEPQKERYVWRHGEDRVTDGDTPQGRGRGIKSLDLPYPLYLPISVYGSHGPAH